MVEVLARVGTGALYKTGTLTVGWVSSTPPAADGRARPSPGGVGERTEPRRTVAALTVLPASPPARPPPQPAPRRRRRRHRGPTASRDGGPTVATPEPDAAAAPWSERTGPRTPRRPRSPEGFEHPEPPPPVAVLAFSSARFSGGGVPWIVGPDRAPGRCCSPRRSTTRRGHAHALAAAGNAHHGARRAPPGPRGRGRGGPRSRAPRRCCR
ncbi:hypothetical protein QJS66_09655 [Kocuria rhizophila]|nr:hypothetical protein QJS66_09655 [Kocuria rhizophila]